MQIRIYERGEFHWDDENIEHIARHGVEPWEAEDAILDPDRVGASARNVPGERRFVVGSTELEARKEADVIKLYQAEWCPFSHLVRAKLTELGVTYEAINVRADGEERTEIKELTGGITTPVMIDGDKVFSESSEIISYLKENYSPQDQEGAHAQREELSPTVSQAISSSFDEALEHTKEALQEAGFKLLGEFDLAPELDWKGSFTLLVAVEQDFAKQVANASPAAAGFGVLQVAVYEQEGHVYVSAIKPQRVAAPIRAPEVNSTGLEVQEQLTELIESLGQRD